ncbi:MAG: FlgD immunoglobulin-like domain containing protein [Candidatus Eisenbacteria bacterium]
MRRPATIGEARERSLPAAFASAALLTVLALALGISPASGQEQNAGAAGEWLSRYTSARTLGLGGAYVSMADDPLGVLWNPAGLSSMNENELRFENGMLFDQTSLNAFGLAIPGSWLPSFGLAFVSLKSSDFERTNDMNDPLGSFSQGETAWLFTASRSLSPRLAVGANLKMVQQSIESFSAGGFGVDVGATFSPVPGLKLGASVANLSGPTVKLRDTDETWPAVARGGATLAVLGGRALLTAQVDRLEGLGPRLHAGTEYWVQPGFALRVGFDQSAGTGGFSYQFAHQYRLDYGVADHPLGLTHRVGMSWRFGGFHAASTADPEIFSPTGERAVTRINLYSRTKARPATWTLDILDKGDAVVRRFGGNGQPPSHLQWDGKDENGLPLADGTYRYRLVVRDDAGRLIEGPERALEIFTTGPQGVVPVVPVQ